MQLFLQKCFILFCSLTVLMVSCIDESSDVTSGAEYERGAGKADRIYAGHCKTDEWDVCSLADTSAPDGNCFCDEQCTQYGDCCEDYGSSCLGMEYCMAVTECDSQEYCMFGDNGVGTCKNAYSLYEQAVESAEPRFRFDRNVWVGSNPRATVFALHAMEEQGIIQSDYSRYAVELALGGNRFLLVLFHLSGVRALDSHDGLYRVVYDERGRNVIPLGNSVVGPIPDGMTLDELVQDLNENPLPEAAVPLSVQEIGPNMVRIRAWDLYEVEAVAALNDRYGEGAFELDAYRLAYGFIESDIIARYPEQGDADHCTLILGCNTGLYCAATSGQHGVCESAEALYQDAVERTEVLLGQDEEIRPEAPIPGAVMRLFVVDLQGTEVIQGSNYAVELELSNGRIARALYSLTGERVESPLGGLYRVIYHPDRGELWITLGNGIFGSIPHGMMSFEEFVADLEASGIEGLTQPVQVEETNTCGLVRIRTRPMYEYEVQQSLNERYGDGAFELDSNFVGISSAQWLSDIIALYP